MPKLELKLFQMTEWCLTRHTNWLMEIHNLKRNQAGQIPTAEMNR